MDEESGALDALGGLRRPGLLFLVHSALGRGFLGVVGQEQSGEISRVFADEGQSREPAKCYRRGVVLALRAQGLVPARGGCPGGGGGQAEGDALGGGGAARPVIGQVNESEAGGRQKCSPGGKRCLPHCLHRELRWGW